MRKKIRYTYEKIYLGQKDMWIPHDIPSLPKDTRLYRSIDFPNQYKREERVGRRGPLSRVIYFKAKSIWPEEHEDEYGYNPIYDDLIIHRDNGPAIILYNTTTGEVERETWYKDGNAYKDISYWPGGEINTENLYDEKWNDHDPKD